MSVNMSSCHEMQQVHWVTHGAPAIWSIKNKTEAGLCSHKPVLRVAAHAPAVCLCCKNMTYYFICQNTLLPGHCDGPAVRQQLGRVNVCLSFSGNGSALARSLSKMHEHFSIHFFGQGCWKIDEDAQRNKADMNWPNKHEAPLSLCQDKMDHGRCHCCRPFQKMTARLNGFGAHKSWYKFRSAAVTDLNGMLGRSRSPSAQPRQPICRRVLKKHPRRVSVALTNKLLLLG